MTEKEAEEFHGLFQFLDFSEDDCDTSTSAAEGKGKGKKGRKGVEPDLTYSPLLLRPGHFLRTVYGHANASESDTAAADDTLESNKAIEEENLSTETTGINTRAISRKLLIECMNLKYAQRNYLECLDLVALWKKQVDYLLLTSGGEEDEMDTTPSPLQQLEVMETGIRSCLKLGLQDRAMELVLELPIISSDSSIDILKAEVFSLSREGSTISNSLLLYNKYLNSRANDQLIWFDLGDFFYSHISNFPSLLCWTYFSYSVGCRHTIPLSFSKASEIYNKRRKRVQQASMRMEEVKKSFLGTSSDEIKEMDTMMVSLDQLLPWIPCNAEITASASSLLDTIRRIHS